jgi:two-component system response regulator HydG/two-component system response regulator AtoC
MRSIKDSIRRLAGSPRSAVLVRGEGGSGKDTVAHVIHRTTSDQSPFVYVSPSALSERALEVELLGVESSDELPQGQVGLLERADRGTLYIDEIADTPLALQATLIRFLRDGAFRRLGGTSERFSELRVIAASSRDLQAAVREGTLRSELFQRLSAATIEVPPLRERPSDLPLLTRHLLEAISRRISRPMPNVPDSTMKVLSEYQWPGNVRELANVLERAALLGEAGEIEEKHLGLRSSRTSEISYRLPSQGIDFAELERDVIVQALQHTRGNQSKAAALLGMTRDQIRYRLAKFGLTSRGEAAESAEARAG